VARNRARVGKCLAIAHSSNSKFILLLRFPLCLGADTRQIHCEPIHFEYDHRLKSRRRSISRHLFPHHELRRPNLQSKTHFLSIFLTIRSHPFHQSGKLPQTPHQPSNPPNNPASKPKLQMNRIRLPRTPLSPTWNTKRMSPTKKADDSMEVE
jgi:hypothetical protein